jgi:hypothetical protein
MLRTAATRPFGLTATLALLILLMALALRIVAARGDLWLDEIWSLHLIDQIKAGVVLPSIAADNNHYLNTLYLALVGADAPPLVQRAFSILLSTATVAVAGWLQQRRGIVAVVAAMSLFALVFPLVDLGSEARGYGGFMLATLLSIAAAERAIARGDRRSSLLLGISNVVGVLFQPLMLGVIGSLGLWALWVSWDESRSLRTTYERVRDLFAWTVRLLIPVVVIIGIAVYFGRTGYSLGGVQLFDASAMLQGIALNLRMVLGLPEGTPSAVAPLIFLALIALTAVLRRPQGDRRLSLYLAVIFAMPAAMFLARLPNTNFARYYLAQDLCFLLLIADLCAALWARGTAMRAACAVLLGAILVGNVIEGQRLIHLGRGDMERMLSIVARDGAGPITSNAVLRDQPVITFFLKKLKMEGPFVDFGDVCETPPRWILTSDRHANLPEEPTIGKQKCALTFRRVETSGYWGLSGMRWTLYRAE